MIDPALYEGARTQVVATLSTGDENRWGFGGQRLSSASTFVGCFNRIPRSSLGEMVVKQPFDNGDEVADNSVIEDEPP